VENFGAAQHRFGWDTPPVKTDAAKVLSLDDTDLQTKLGATNGGHVAPGPCPNHDQIKVLSHCVILRVRI